MISMIFRKEVVLIFLLASTVIFAQKKAALNGHIYDQEGLPLSAALIEIPSQGLKTVADLHGYYSFLALEPGEVMVRVSYSLYETQQNPIRLEVGKTSNLDVVLGVVELEGITLNTSLKGQNKALNTQKNSDGIVNVVSEDQVGKFPDSNIGDAIKRISGIAVQNDQGEARDIIIRGLAPQLNSVTLNGDRIPSAEGDNRRIQMDLIPSDMVQTVVVSKTLTPDQEADAIGGAVNLVTRNAANKPRLSVSGAYGQGQIRNPSPAYDLSLIASDRFLDDKLGVALGGTLYSTGYGSDNVEFEWKKSEDTNASYVSDQQIRKYDVKRVRKSVSANLDFKWNDNNTLFFKTIYNHRNDWENRYRLRFKNITEPDAEGRASAKSVERQTKGGIHSDRNDNKRLEDQRLYKFSLKGKHLLWNVISADWKLFYAKASEERPNERYITYQNKNPEVSQNLSDRKRPFVSTTDGSGTAVDRFKLKEISEEFKDTDEATKGVKINLKIPFNEIWKPIEYLKVGYQYNQKDKLRNNRYTEYAPLGDNLEKLSQVDTSDESDKGFMAGEKYQIGHFATADFLGGLNLKSTATFESEAILEEYIPVNYNAQERIQSGYVMFKMHPAEKLDVVGGLRIEQTKTTYTGNLLEFDEAGDVSKQSKRENDADYSNILPNLQLKYHFSKNTKLHLAYTNAIARPNYYDLVPYVNIIREDSEIAFGNPELKATRATNFDMIFEHYFKSFGVISVGSFYKTVDDFIYEIIENGYSDSSLNVENYEATTIQNGESAKLFGVELAFQRRLDFLPGLLRNLNIYANYTATTSQTNAIKGRQNEKLSLAGVVPNMFNTSLSYESSKLLLRGSLNYADDYIDEYGSETFFDNYYDEQLFLDFNGSYTVSKKLMIFANLKNITNQPLRYYQGVSGQTAQEEYYGFNWKIGLKYTF